MTFIPPLPPLILWSRKGQIQNPAVLPLWLWGFRVGHKLPISLSPLTLALFLANAKLTGLEVNDCQKQYVYTYRQPVAWKCYKGLRLIYLLYVGTSTEYLAQLQSAVPRFEEFFPFNKNQSEEKQTKCQVGGDVILGSSGRELSPGRRDGFRTTRTAAP